MTSTLRRNWHVYSRRNRQVEALEAGGTKTYALQDPVDGLTEDAVRTVMQKIIDKKAVASGEEHATEILGQTAAVLLIRPFFGVWGRRLEGAFWGSKSQSKSQSKELPRIMCAAALLDLFTV